MSFELCRPTSNMRWAWVVAEGEYVMIHGRYTGWAPKPVVAVDIFRIVGGKLVEHWDVLQEEVPVEKTVNGHPMFTPATL